MTKTQSLAKIIESCRFDPKEEIPEDVPVFKIQEKIIGTLGNFIAIAGKPKAGKSTFLSAILASAFLPGDIWGLKIDLPVNRKKILYIDTEQSKWTYKRVYKRVASLIGMDNVPGTLQTLLVREHDPKTILAIIERLTKDPEVGLLFVDGLLDLVENFNDEYEAGSLTRFFKRLTKERDILTIGVIHRSRSTGYSLGHLGANIERYAESTLLVEKDDTKKFITLSAGLLRNTIEEFIPITIMNNGEDFVTSDIDIDQRSVDNRKYMRDAPFAFTESEHKTLIGKILPLKGLVYQALVDEIVQARAVSKIKAKEFIKHWLDNDLVIKDEKGLYRDKGWRQLFDNQ